MQLFQRTLEVRGGLDAIGWAVNITNVVQAATDVPVSLWQGMWGMRPGTVIWSAPIDGLAQVADLNATLAADADYAAATKAGAEFVSDVDVDRVARIIHGEITEPAAIGSFVTGVRATASAAKIGAAAAWAVKIADVVTGVTGRPMVVTSTTAGPMFEFGWLARHENAASIDAASLAISESEAYMAEVAGSGDMFLPGAMQVSAQRIA